MTEPRKEVTTFSALEKQFYLARNASQRLSMLTDQLVALRKEVSELESLLPNAKNQTDQAWEEFLILAKSI